MFDIICDFYLKIQIHIHFDLTYTLPQIEPNIFIIGKFSNKSGILFLSLTISLAAWISALYAETSCIKCI